MQMVGPQHIRRVRGFACAVALSVLAGWVTRTEWAITWGGSTEMVPNTALCVLLLWVTMAMRTERRRRDAAVMISDGGAVGVAIVALTVLCPIPAVAHALDDVILTYPPLHGSGVAAPGHISPGTAIGLIAICVGIFVRSRRWRQGLAITAVVSVVCGVGGLFHWQTAVPSLAAVSLLAFALYKERRHV